MAPRAASSSFSVIGPRPSFFTSANTSGFSGSRAKRIVRRHSEGLALSFSRAGGAACFSARAALRVFSFTDVGVVYRAEDEGAGAGTEVLVVEERFEQFGLAFAVGSY